MGQIAKKSLARLGRLLRRGPNTPILMYHSVHPRHSLAVEPRLFRQQIAWLVENYRVVTLDQYIESKVAGNLPASWAAVTFDDGYRDNYVHAYPVLKEFACPATIFVASSFIETEDRGQSGPDAGFYPQLEALTWEELRAMAPLVRAGAHTHSHVDLGRASVEDMLQELDLNRHLIRTNLGQEPRVLAFPWGQPRNLPRDGWRELESRFLGAVTTVMGSDNRSSRISAWRLQRLGVAPADDLDLFASRVRGELDLLRWARSWRGYAAPDQGGIMPEAGTVAGCEQRSD